MYEAEHLDLFTNVRDNFTDDLTRLSGLLETVGQQADALTPIRIRVVTHDRQLRQTQRRLAQLQGQEVTTNIAGGDSVRNLPMVHQSSHTTGRTPAEIFRESVRDFDGAVGSFTDAGPDSTAAAIGLGGLGFASLSSAIGEHLSAPSGAGGAGVNIDLSDFAPRELEQMFGIPVSQMASGQQFRPSALSRGESPFTMATEHLEDALSPTAIGRAMEPQRLIRHMEPDRAFDVVDPRQDILSQLARLDMGQLTEVFGGRGGLMSALGDSVDDTTAQFEQLKESFFDIRIGMTQFYDFLAAAVPLMFVFIGSIPAIVGALGGLGAAALGAAGALASIAGLGLLGRAAAEAGGDTPGFEEITEVLEDLPDEFFESFRPLMDRLEPVFADGLENVGFLFDELARAGAVLPQLEDDARAFARFIVPFLAGTLQELFLLADHARPLFARMAAGLEEMGVIRGFTRSLDDALPHLTHLTGILIDALPALQSFSMGMLDVASSIATIHRYTLGFLTDAISLFGRLGDGSRILGRLAGAFFVLLSSIFLTTKVATVFRTQLWDLSTSLLGTAKAQASWNAVLNASTIKAKAAAAANFGLAMSIAALRKAFIALVATTGIGVFMLALGEAVTWVADRVGVLNDELSDTADLMKEVQRQEDRMGSRGGAYLGDLERDVYIDVTEHNETNIEGNADASTVEYESFVSSDRSTDTLL